jgi:hypothetical protein
MIALFLTYNSVGFGLESGRHSNGAHTAYVAQGFLRKGSSSQSLAEKGECLIVGWGQLQSQLRVDNVPLSEVDYFVINCGKMPKLAQTLVQGLPAQKIVFVHCMCGPPLQRDSALEAAWYIYTACGGIATMGRIFSGVLETGKVTAYMTYGEALLPKGV